ncbi:HAMP domain-containing protein [Dickeya dianthicola]|uniref:methyl-accepting chemotaxis protein n=1 Tax=Dickeya dianthicola TaxID=204039 RepID=UPI0003A3D993|nr:methyl-accepting chemotaxis protein [Dickeya dianthicola]MCI4029979.1 nitrate- and nitrite sensing domain-containing protein [Dickeya dianthicola]MCI4173565.1 nitrate- and nitrite sensing domain-containing protein [Dickeya dianthicola]MCI4175638.1 nitrate- and nitrite sensing domain-containing protein [Dickeya dianthicola]MCI4182143.1 nitrate- and nitrite sensing domain-containing protein [Dickeya dianthicola]MCI4193461.1 nitrate- and nitrite sensing domain-containing protein [Dickeya diant
MLRLSSLSIRYKFALALMPLLIALLWFAGNGVLERRHTEQDMVQFSQLLTLAQRAGNAAHALQRERGMSSGFIGSKGQKFADPLRTQRVETDKALAALWQSQSALALSSSAEGIAQRLSSLRERLQTLSSLRAQVDGFSLPTSQVVGWYTISVSDLIALVGDMSHLVTDGGLVTRVAAYYNLLNIKEQAGIMRALLSEVFAVDRFAPGQYERFSQLGGMENAYTTAFNQFAQPALRQQLQALLNDAAVQTALKMRDTAFAKAASGRFGIDANDWFSQQTQRIDRLKVIEDAACAELLSWADMLEKQARLSGYGYLGGTVAALLLALLLAVLVARNVYRQLTSTLKTIDEMGNDLTCRLDVPGKDELSQLNQAYNRSLENIEHVVCTIKQGAELVERASNEIAQGNQDLAQRTDEQAASLVETASSMEQITVAVKQTADYAAQASELMKTMGEQINVADQVTLQASEAMTQIRQSSEQMSQITAAIDAIAFQTNLLALNASVEAARAGEQGRGFAVVATEVRNLAQRSAGESQRIRELISTSINQVHAGVTLVTRSSETMKQIMTSTSQVRDFVSDIATAAREQSLGVDQVHLALNQLEQVTQQNAVLVSEAATASQLLDKQASDMKETVDRFVVADNSDVRIGLPR